MPPPTPLSAQLALFVSQHQDKCLTIAAFKQQKHRLSNVEPADIFHDFVQGNPHSESLAWIETHYDPELPLAPFFFTNYRAFVEHYLNKARKDLTRQLPLSMETLQAPVESVCDSLVTASPTNLPQPSKELLGALELLNSTLAFRPEKLLLAPLAVCSLLALHKQLSGSVRQCLTSSDWLLLFQFWCESELLRLFECPMPQSAALALLVAPVPVIEQRLLDNLVQAEALASEDEQETRKQARRNSLKVQRCKAYGDLRRYLGKRPALAESLRCLYNTTREANE